MSKFQIHTIDTAPEAAKEALQAVKNNNGFIPNLIGVLANAPTALETYRTVGAINQRTSLTPTERSCTNYRSGRKWLWFLRSRAYRNFH